MLALLVSPWGALGQRADQSPRDTRLNIRTIIKLGGSRLEVEIRTVRPGCISPQVQRREDVPLNPRGDRFG